MSYSDSQWSGPTLKECRIYLVHDDAKEKDFELEVSWIGPESDNLHVHVPDDLLKDAEAKAKAALETFE